MQVEDCNVAVNSTVYLHYCRSDHTALLFVSEYCLIAYSIISPWIYVVNFNGDLSFQNQVTSKHFQPSEYKVLQMILL